MFPPAPQLFSFYLDDQVPLALSHSAAAGIEYMITES